MSRMRSVGIAIIILSLMLVLTAAKPPATNDGPFAIYFQEKTCGWECDPNDGCLGVDESLRVWASGDLEPNQVWSYTYPTGNQEGEITTEGLLCYSGIIRATITDKGPHGNPTAILTATSAYDGEVVISEGGPADEICIKNKPGIWSFTLTNDSDRVARDVHLSIYRTYTVTNPCGA